jgi:hypothetical protein
MLTRPSADDTLHHHHNPPLPTTCWLLAAGSWLLCTVPYQMSGRRSHHRRRCAALALERLEYAISTDSPVKLPWRSLSTPEHRGSAYGAVLHSVVSSRTRDTLRVQCLECQEARDSAVLCTSGRCKTRPRPPVIAGACLMCRQHPAHVLCCVP